MLRKLICLALLFSTVSCSQENSNQDAALPSAQDQPQPQTDTESDADQSSPSEPA